MPPGWLAKERKGPSLPISPETEDLIREAWAAQIPPQYRAPAVEGKEWKGDAGICPSALIAPPPPGALLDRFFEMIYANRHLTEPQRKEKAKREATAQKAIAKRQLTLAGCKRDAQDNRRLIKPAIG